MAFIPYSFLNQTGLARPLRVFYQGLREPRRFQKELNYARRFRRFRAQHGSFISEKSPHPPTNKKVLVFCLFDVPFMVEYLCCLVKSLQIQGHQPIILTNTRDHSFPYFKLFGFKDILFLDDLKQKHGKTAPDERLPAICDFKSTEEIKNYSYQGVHVGRHVLSLASRMLREGDISLNNPIVVRSLESLWPNVLPTLKTARYLFDQVKPHTSLFPEIGYFPFGEFFDVSLQKGVNTVEFSGSHKIQCINLKRYAPETADLHPQSLSPETWEWVKKMKFTPAMEKKLFEEIEAHYESGGWTNEERLQYGKKIKTKEDVILELGLDPSKKTAVIFSHILWDATFFYGKDLFENYAEWLVETVRAACANPHLNWVVKLHPANVWKSIQDGAKGKEFNEIALLEKRLGALPPHIKIIDSYTDINTFSLFELTDYCLTVRGTIGIEMPCYGIPTFVTGTGRYGGLGFTYDSDSPQDYLEKLKKLETFPKMDPKRLELAKRHAYALFLMRPLDFKTAQFHLHTDAGHGGLTERDVVIHAKSMADLVNASDVKAFADWVMNSTESDYMAYPA